MKIRIVAMLVLATNSMSGCGLAETAATGAAAGSAAAEQAKQGKQLEDKMRADIDAAQKQEAAARAAAEAAATDSGSQ